MVKLAFKPAVVKHSSLCTIAKQVRRAMLPGNHKVFKKSFAVGAVPLSMALHGDTCLNLLLCRFGWKSGYLIFTGQM